MNLEQQTTNLTNDVKNLIATSQEKAIRAVDFQRVLLYWNNRIFQIANTLYSQLSWINNLMILSALKSEQEINMVEGEK